MEIRPITSQYNKHLFVFPWDNFIFFWYQLADLAVSNVYKAIFEANLDGRLEELLVNLLRYNSSANVQEPIRNFLYNYQIMSDNFWSTYKNAKTYEDVLGCYYQFSKNQCVIIETLLENLKLTLDDYNVKEDLQVMLRNGFTF